MTPRPHPGPLQDPELDRALSLARTPRVPADLAARIVRDVTKLPQQPAAPEPIVAPVQAEQRPPRHWLRAAGVAALLLIGGAAAAVLTRNASPEASAGQQLAQQQVAPELRAVVTPPYAGGGAAVALAPTSPAPAARDDRVKRPSEPAVAVPEATPAEVPAETPATIELANTPAPAAPTTQKPSALVQSGPVDPLSNRGVIGPPSSTYGPPQGLGITGTNSLPMPQGSATPPAPRGAPAGPGPGGPLSHP